MCKYHFQWRLTWQRGVCLISARSHVKKALSRRIRYHSQLTLTRQLCESEHIRIKYQIILYHHLWLSGVENTNHCTAQCDLCLLFCYNRCFIIFVFFVSQLYHSLFDHFCLLSRDIYICHASWQNSSAFNFNMSHCHRSNVVHGLHCFYEKHHFLN